METERKLISSKILFEAVAEQLACNRQAVFTVTGMSMWPLIRHGRDQVIVEAVEKEKLRKGDIILFRVSQDHYILHRITGLASEYFETTGDGNLFRDGKFPYDCIIAKVQKVIRKGKTIDCNEPGWKLLFLIWMAAYPIRPQLFRFYRFVRKCRKRFQ